MPPRSEHRRALGAHLLALRVLVYAGVSLALAPLAGTAGLSGAAGGAVVGIAAAGVLAGGRLRLGVLLGAAVACAGLGLVAHHVLGRSDVVVDSLGVAGSLELIDAVTFGLLAAGLAGFLVTLSSRWPICTLIEATVLAFPVLWTFKAHRHLRIGQPRFLADWAFERGYDPEPYLFGVGIATALVLAMAFVRRQTAKRTAGVLVVLLLFLGALYLLVPEVARPLRDDKPPQSEVRPPDPPTGDGSGSGLSPPNAPNRPVALVQRQSDYAPAGFWYFREETNSRYDGRFLRASAVPGVDDRIAPHTLGGVVELPAPPLPVSMAVSVSTVVHLLGPARPFGLVTPVRLEPLPITDPIFRQSWRATATIFTPPFGRRGPLVRRLLADAQAGDPSWSPEVRAVYLEAPQHPRYAQLLERIIGDLPAEYRRRPWLVAEAVRLWLEEHCEYSFDIPDEGRLDPTSDFLFGSRKGWCVHAAHAMALLLRLARIPTRVGLGFASSPANVGHRSSFVIMSRDAHAWPELYLDGIGWIGVDAAIQGQVAPPPPPDPSTVSQLIEKTTHDPKAVAAEEESARWYQRLAWQILALLPPFALGVLYAIKAWRRAAPWWGGPLYVTVYRASLDRLAEVGLVRMRAETREDFARRVSMVVPELEPLTLAHLRRALTGEDRWSSQEWRAAERGVTRRLAAAFSRLRRVRGMLDPLSWWSTT